MGIEALIDSKFEASKLFAEQLVARNASLLAAYWEFREDVDRWTLVLVPWSPDKERKLIEDATDLLIEKPYRSVFSMSDPAVDSRQIERAKALGAYIRTEPYIGRRIDTTFTGGHYFEAVIPVYLHSSLTTHLSAVS